MSYFRDISTFGGCAAGPAAALENMRILEDEKLLENTTAMGEYLMEQLEVLKGKHAMIGDVRGKGLFCGMELVLDRDTREPVPETIAQAIVADCFEPMRSSSVPPTDHSAVSITRCASHPALICTKSDLDEVVASVDRALTKVATA